MGYNYCLVIVKKEIVESILDYLEEESASVALVIQEDGSDLVQDECSLLSYKGREFPDLDEKFRGDTLTLYVDGRMANYEVQGNWDLAASFDAGISIQMGESLLLL